MITLQLPYPPSANRLWRNVGGKTLKSSAYRAWLVQALALLRGQRFTPHAGSYRLTIYAVRPDKRRRDIDNICKPIADCLVQGGVIEDDSLAQSMTAAWAWDQTTPGGSVTVRVEPAEFPIFLMGGKAA